MTKLPRGKLKILCYDLEAVRENDARRRANGLKYVPTVRCFVDPKGPRRMRNALQAFGAEINGKSRIVYSGIEMNSDDGAAACMWVETTAEVILLDSVEDGIAGAHGNLFTDINPDDGDVSTDEESE